jgi:O-methyltransferase involved in polyketide biosynthesis
MLKASIGVASVVILSLVAYKYLTLDDNTGKIAEKKNLTPKSTNKITTDTDAVTQLMLFDKNISKEEEHLFDIHSSKKSSLVENNGTMQKKSVKIISAKKKEDKPKAVHEESDKNFSKSVKSAVLTDREYEDVENWMIETGQIAQSNSDERSFEDNLKQEKQKEETVVNKEKATQEAATVVQPMISDEKYEDIEKWMTETGQIEKTKLNSQKEDIYEASETKDIKPGQMISDDKYKDIEKWMIKTGEIKNTSR